MLHLTCSTCSFRYKGLIILETFTTKEGSDLALPDFLEIVKEVTDDKDYSMYNLALKEHYCGQ